MYYESTRFGRFEAGADDVIVFEAGLLGLPECRRWAILLDPATDRIAWLQSLDRPDVAVAVVSPRQLVPNYRPGVARGELAPLALGGAEEAQVLLVVAPAEGGWSLNLKAPLVINPARRLGRQVIANGDLPVRFEVGEAAPSLKRIA